MTPPRADPGLPLPEASPAPPRIGSAEWGPALPAVAADRAFFVESGAVALGGPERGSVASVSVAGRIVARNVEVDAGPAVNLVAAPGMLRRERLGRSGSIIETLLAAPTLPLAAIQWAPPAGAPRSVGPFDVKLTLAPGAAAARYRAGPTGVTIVEEARPDEPTMAVLHPAPASWTVEEAPEGGVRVRCRVEACERVTLMLASGATERVGAALRAGAHLDAQERRLHGDAVRRGLRVRSGVGELDEGLSWAQERLASALARSGPVRPERVFWSALGALAVGDPESSRRALRLLESDARPVGPTSDAPSVEPAADALSFESVPDDDAPPLPPGPLATFVAARLALTLGETAPALRHAAALDTARLERIRAGADEPEWALWSLTLETLADALRHGASEQEIRRLREASALPPGGRPGQVRLPMVGASAGSPATPASLFRLLLRGGRTSRVPPVRGPVSGLLGAWALMAGGETARGYTLWRSALSAGLVGRSGPLGTWEETHEPSIPGAPATATLLSGFVHGLLGCFPDAPTGRLELFPALPEHFTSFEVANLPLGDARLTLTYRREAGLTTYSATPTRGGVPVNLVLVPSLPGARVLAARVDGAPADLEWHPHGSGVRIQVQLPLDRERTLEVETR